MDGKEQFAEQLNVLYRISNVLSSGMDLDKILENILNETVDLFAADAGSVMLLENGSLRICKAAKLSDDIVKNTRIPLGHGIAGTVASTGESVLLNGKVDSSQFSDVVERVESISSSMCSAMSYNGKVVGVLTIRRADTTFTEEQFEFFKSVAAQAAVALEMADLYRHEHERLERTNAEKRHMLSIFSHMADGVLVFDDSFEISFANELAQRMLHAWGPLEGQDVRMFFPSVPWKFIVEGAKNNEVSKEIDLLPVLSHGEEQWRGLLTSWTDEGVLVHVLVMHDVTERIRVERMKTEFLSSVSHELKTPLTSIIGFLELLMEREMKRERQMRCLSICRDESGRLLRLIEDVLMVAKLENGSFRVSKSHNMIDVLLSEAVSNFAERYPSYTFSYSGDCDKVGVDYDEVLINQVVTNLLSNAVKYTPNEGRIAVRLMIRNGAVVVSVTDNGVGIPQEKLPFIFEKFYRVDNSLTRQTGGVGLGLANSRHIVEAHGGSIWAESEEGKGSTFFFALPYELKN